MEDSYAPCDTCGNWVDDGSYIKDGYLCHDCLNKKGEINLRKFGYTYSFNIHGKENEDGDIRYLDVEVVMDYNVTHSTSDEFTKDTSIPDFSDYLKVYLDLKDEKIKVDVEPNPYFDSVSIQDYSVNSFIAPFDAYSDVQNEKISESKCDEILAEYLLNVKNNEAPFEKNAQCLSYFFVEEHLGKHPRF